MSASNDGGQAFPSHPSLYSTKDQAEAQGMSLRDYFAAQALVGTLAGRSVPWPADACAREAYEIADAMLKARGQ